MADTLEKFLRTVALAPVDRVLSVLENIRVQCKERKELRVQ